MANKKNAYVKLRTAGQDAFDAEMVQHDSDINMSSLESMILDKQRQLTQARKQAAQGVNAISVDWNGVISQKKSIRVLEAEIEAAQGVLEEYFA